MATNPHANSAAKNGGIIGIVLMALLIIDWQLKISLHGNTAMSFLQIAILVALLCIFTRRKADSMGDAGMSYGKCLGYIVSMMFFAGIIIGVFQYIMQNYIAIDYYREIMDNAMLQSGIDMNSPAFERGMAMTQKLQRSPVFVTLVTMLTMMFYGGVIGLIASAFLKRNPNIFADTHESNEPQA
jgi:hypothetical protein